MQHLEEGRRIMNQIVENLADIGKVERPPTMDGKKMTAMLMPIKSGSKQKKDSPRLAKPKESSDGSGIAERLVDANGASTPLTSKPQRAIP
jgi:hypothetical protein